MEVENHWRKSSHSGAAGAANCVEVGIAPWRKSSYSGNSGSASCIEAAHVPGAVLIRDTKDRGSGPVLRVTPADWATFTASIKS
jgi:hypothetical protein